MFQKLPSKFSIPEEDEEEYDADECPSSADIEIVHSKETPPLHSILKQRSISENSEDCQSSSSESPTGTSPRELDGQKRGVHFSSHIDKTTYKSNMSVNSMKVTLKSKRRRNRKREEKKKEKCRKRHNSTGSECSSCDEHDTKVSSESHSDDDLGSQIDEAGKKVTENGVIVEEEHVEKLVQKEESNDLNMILGEETVDKVLNKQSTENPDEKSDVQDEGIKTKMTKGSKLVQDVKKKLTEKIEIPVGEDSDDDVEEEFRTCKNGADDIEIDDENSQKKVDRTSGSDENSVSDLVEKCSISEGTDPTVDIKGAADDLTDVSGTNSAIIGQNQGTGEPENPLSENKQINNMEDGMHEMGDNMSECEKVIKPVVSDQSECMSKSSNVSEGKSELVTKDNSKKENGEKSVNDANNVVETDLSWKEPKRAASNNEHRNECAFKFANAMMFDLDFD